MKKPEKSKKQGSPASKRKHAKSKRKHTKKIVSGAAARLCPVSTPALDIIKKACNSNPAIRTAVLSVAMLLAMGLSSCSSIKSTATHSAPQIRVMDASLPDITVETTTVPAK